MNNVKELVWKHRFGIIGTLFIHLVFVMYSRNQVIMSYEPKYGEEADEIVMDFSEPEIEKKEEYVLDESGNIINKEFAAQDERRESDQNYDARFNKSSVDEQIYNELKALEQQTFDKIAEQRGAIPENKTESTPNTNTQNTAKTETPPSSSGALKGTTTAEYDLGGRRHEGNFPKPSYTCIGSGKLVVIIKVDRNGKVIYAKVDAAASSFSEECMRQAAETYARRAKFEASGSAPDPQQGTITYRYVAQ